MAYPYKVPKDSWIEKVVNATPSKGVSTVTGIALKAARALILKRRFDNHGEIFPEHIKTDKDAYQEGSLSFVHQRDIFNRRRDSSENLLGAENVDGEDSATATKGRTIQEKPDHQDVVRNARQRAPEFASLRPIGTAKDRPRFDAISIIDVDHSWEPRSEFEGNRNSRPFYVELPFTPTELRFTHNTKYAALATLGRNNPKYQFTGAEESLSFTIDWHSFAENRLDVLANCKWLEAMSKADSFEEGPHRVMVQWSADPILMRDSLWLIEKADYTLSQFNASRMDASYYDQTHALYRKGEAINTNMMPKQAMQTVVLKRVTNYNLSSAEIGDFERLNPR